MLCGLSWGEMLKPSTEELGTEFHRLVQSNDQRNLGSIGSCGDGCESDNDASDDSDMPMLLFLLKF